MKYSIVLTVALLLLLTATTQAEHRFGNELRRINRSLAGHVVDHTHNHRSDNRIWSNALQQKRDMYVYLPPGFDPAKRYPVIIWLHGFGQDEKSFIHHVVKPIDCAMQRGELPLAIVVAPDGSLGGHASFMNAGSFFINSKAGRFEDYLIQDVWGFVLQHYPIRPEREAHVLAGVSAGGAAAFNLAIKYKDLFKTAAGIFPPLNTRWVDCNCRYMRPFDPCCWGWRTDFSRGCEVVGRFYCVIKIRLKRLMDPLYDRNDPDIVEQVSRENVIEMIDHHGLRDGELNMYVAYGGRDQFNIHAQVESFLYRARERSLTVAVGYDPNGKHDLATALKLFPGIVEWLRPLLTPYSPLN